MNKHSVPNLRISWFGFSLMALVAFYFLHQVGDTWWSLRLGEDFFKGENIFIERYSWTASGDWYPNHEWLYEVTVYLLWKLGGDTLIFVHAVSAILIALSLCLTRISSSVAEQLKLTPSLVACSGALGALFIALANLGFMETRAMIFSFFFTALFMHLIRAERYFWLPPVMLLWANFHGGFFQGGIILFVAFCVAIILALQQRTPHRIKRAKMLLGSGILTLIATFMTPLHYHAWTYIIGNTDKTATSTSEFRPVWEVAPYLNFWLALTFFFALLILPKARDYLRHWETGVTLVVAVLFWTAGLLIARFTPLFLMVAYPLMMWSLMQPWGKPFTKVQKFDLGASIKINSLRWGSIAVGISALGIMALLTPQKLTADKAMLPPNAAFSAIADSCKNPIYNDYNAGAYLLWADKDFKVFVDNRYDPYSNEVRHLTHLDSTMPWLEVFKKYDIDCAFVTRYTASGPTLEEAGWIPAWADNNWVLFTKA